MAQTNSKQLSGSEVQCNECDSYLAFVVLNGIVKFDIEKGEHERDIIQSSYNTNWFGSNA